MKIYLADLGHNQVTISSDVYPLGIANLAAYAHGHWPGQAAGSSRRPTISLFREPQDLKQALERESPDILGLSSYSWNHELARQFARYAKALNGQVLTLMGGPNFPLTVAEQEQFLHSMPEIDVAVRGPTYEGERAFLNIASRYAQVGLAREGLWEEPVAGSVWIDGRTDEFVQGAEVERIRYLDEIPSAYLGGWLDSFFETGYFPMMQLSRGCPFSCTFCNSSVRSNSKIYSYSIERIQADLEHVARHVRPEIPLCLADDNFGMYQLDEEVADYIAYLQDHHDWPQYIRTTTGKNRHDRIIRVMRKTRGVLPMTAAVQSLDPTVLSNIKRDNIKLSAYAAIQREVEAQGMQSYGELILSMPGETKASFMRSVRDLLDAGVKRISAHQLMLLHGAPLSNPDSRALWQFGTRYRVVARNIGRYLDEPAIELEEIVVETPTFSFEEYLEARVFHLLLTIFYYEGNYEEAFALSRQHGISAYDLIVRLQEMLDGAPDAFQQVINDFIRESQEELFDSRESCLSWAREHFDELIDGSLGGNLLSKYSLLGRFFTMHESLDFLHAGILSLAAEKTAVIALPVNTGPTGEPEAAADALFQEELEAVISYLRTLMLHVPFAEALEARPRWEATHDIEAWRQQGYEQALADYRFHIPVTYETFVSPATKTRLLSRLETFGESATGLGKFTRTLFARDLRRQLKEI